VADLVKSMNADWKMSGCNDSATTPDLSDTEFCGPVDGPLGPIEGSER